MTVFGGGFLAILLFMFWLEDRYGGGLYDPDPSADFRYREQKRKRND